MVIAITNNSNNSDFEIELDEENKLLDERNKLLDEENKLLDAKIKLLKKKLLFLLCIKLCLIVTVIYLLF